MISKRKCYKIERYISRNEKDTIAFAKNFAKTLSENDVIVLDGELGSR